MIPPPICPTSLAIVTQVPITGFSTQHVIAVLLGSSYGKLPQLLLQSLLQSYPVYTQPLLEKGQTSVSTSAIGCSGSDSTLGQNAGGS